MLDTEIKSPLCDAMMWCVLLVVLESPYGIRLPSYFVTQELIPFEDLPSVIGNFNRLNPVAELTYSQGNDPSRTTLFRFANFLNSPFCSNNTSGSLPSVGLA
ncbi:hypothetical protein D3C74_325990 [compost metagenome]